MIIKVTNARICFCQNLFTPTPVLRRGIEEKEYGSAFLLPKSDPQIRMLRSRIQEITSDMWGAVEAPTILAEMVTADRMFFKDSDKMAQYDGFEGYAYFDTLRNIINGPPTVTNKGKTLLSFADGIIYPGCFVDVSINVYAAQDDECGKRIDAMLRAVRFRADGEAMSELSLQ